jgi:hypothetical protein
VKELHGDVQSVPLLTHPVNNKQQQQQMSNRRSKLTYSSAAGQNKLDARRQASDTLRARIPRDPWGKPIYNLNSRVSQLRFTRGAGNVSLAQAMAYRQRTMRSGGSAKGEFRVQHREFISDVALSASGFVANSVDITPRNSSLAKWLYGFSDNFQEYEIKAMRFIYESKCAATTAGYVAFAWQSDPSIEDPVYKAEMMGLKGAQSFPAYKDESTCVLPPSKTLFMRENATTNVRFTNHGTFIWAAEGSGGETVGEIYCDYDIVLKKPTLRTSDQAGYMYSTNGSMVASNWWDATPGSFYGDIDVTHGANRITFNQSFEGLLTIHIAAGTSIDDVIDFGTSTANVDDLFSLASSDQNMYHFRIIAQPGEALIGTIATTGTVTTYLTMAGFPYAYTTA